MYCEAYCRRTPPRWDCDSGIWGNGPNSRIRNRTHIRSRSHSTTDRSSRPSTTGRSIPSGRRRYVRRSVKANP